MNQQIPDISLSLPMPERGFISIQPAEKWEEGLITANGTIALNALSRPLNERIIFNHERLFMPMGAPHVPPNQSRHLTELRKLIEEGKYKEAEMLQFRLSGQKGFMYSEFFVPAFDLTIDSESQGNARGYARSVDFQTGEAVVRWSDDRGAFERRMFVSRADGVAVIRFLAPEPGTLSVKLRLEEREPSNEFNNDSDMDISGGQPSVIIKMLADSFPGKIRLLPALPSAWPRGSIEGVLCRGAITLNRLRWDGDSVEVQMTSAIVQENTLVLPRTIVEIRADGAVLSDGGTAKEKKLFLQAGKPVSFVLTLACNDVQL